MKFLKFLKQIGAITISDDMIDSYYRVSAAKERSKALNSETVFKDRLGQIEKQIANIQAQMADVKMIIGDLRQDLFILVLRFKHGIGPLRGGYETRQEKGGTESIDQFLDQIGVPK
jgi:hypothetical protein